MLHDAQLFTDDFTFFLHIILSKYNTLFILVENWTAINFVAVLDLSIFNLV